MGRLLPQRIRVSSMSDVDFKNISPSTAYRLLHPKSAILVISSGPDGRANGMVAAWTTPLSMNPPLVGVAVAPSRYTHRLIKESREFTMNVLDMRYVRQIHFFGTVSGRNRDKFSESGLTPMKSRKVSAPHVAEALAVLECRTENEVTTGDHTFFIARVVDAYVRRDAFDEVYLPERAKILLHLGGALYTVPGDELISP